MLGRQFDAHTSQMLLKSIGRAADMTGAHPEAFTVDNVVEGSHETKAYLSSKHREGMTGDHVFRFGPGDAEPRYTHFRETTEKGSTSSWNPEAVKTPVHYRDNAWRPT